MRSALALAIVAFCTSVAVAQDQNYKLYNLGDLFAVAPPYPAQVASDLSPGQDHPLFTQPLPTGLSSTADVSAGFVGTAGVPATTRDEFVRLIGKLAGPGGSVTKVGNAYLVSALDADHKNIETVVNLFRTRYKNQRTVSIRAWWMTLSAADLKPILDTPTQTVAGNTPTVFGVISDAGWRDLMRIWGQPADDIHRLRYQSTLTCFNGQTVHSLSGVQDLATSKINVVATQNESNRLQGQIGYEGMPSAVQEGLTFQATPASSQNSKFVTLDVHSRLALRVADKAAPVATRPSVATVLPEDVVKPIDNRRLVVHRLSTTARVPLDRPFLVGGMSVPAAETNGLQLYLIVKVSVQELQD